MRGQADRQMGGRTNIHNEIDRQINKKSTTSQKKTLRCHHHHHHVWFHPLLNIGHSNGTPLSSLFDSSHPATLWMSSPHLAGGCPTLHLTRLGLHYRTRLPQQSSTLWQMWPAHCHYLISYTPLLISSVSPFRYRQEWLCFIGSLFVKTEIILIYYFKFANISKKIWTDRNQSNISHICHDSGNCNV